MKVVHYDIGAHGHSEKDKTIVFDNALQHQGCPEVTIGVEWVPISEALARALRSVEHYRPRPS